MRSLLQLIYSLHKHLKMFTKFMALSTAIAVMALTTVVDDRLTLDSKLCSY